MLDENKWLAARDGLDSELVDLPDRGRVPAKELTRRLLERLAPHAAELGAAEELAGIDDLIKHGTGGARQVVVYEANHDLREVVGEIVAFAPDDESRPAAAGRRRARRYPRGWRSRPFRRLQELQRRGESVRDRVPVLRAAGSQAGAEARPRTRRPSREKAGPRPAAAPPAPRRDPGDRAETRPYATIALIVALAASRRAPSRG